MSTIQFGIDAWLADRGPMPGRIGLVTNDAARTARDPTFTTRAALLAQGVQLIRLFSPEHGLEANAADGIAVMDAVDKLTGLPIVSLYGARLRPPRESLTDLDAVVFDIPDIGARFYTYIWTLWHVLEACAEADVPLIVLDRPNPLGGDLTMAEGPMLDAAKLASFVGRANIPIRHCLTTGELAGLWNEEGARRAELRVISCGGWKRSMPWPATNLPFVPTSPAIANFESALLYPGLCFFEATNLSVGRGTPQAFQTVGAPWLDATATAEQFNALQLPGVTALVEDFTPTKPPWSDQLCSGVRLRVTDSSCFRPVLGGLHLIVKVIALHPDHFQWMSYATAANPGGLNHFELLVGRSGLREILEQNPSDLPERLKHWTTTADWTVRTREFLLYD